jgi:hypothetical protein
MDDATVTDLLAAAQSQSACAKAKCQVSGDAHRWWVVVTHLNDSHVCPFHPANTGSYPQRLIPNHSLFDRDRGELVASLVAWLNHLHSQLPAESIGGGGAPGNGDPSCSPPSDGGSSGGADSDPICWDAVASVPGD